MFDENFYDTEPTKETTLETGVSQPEQGVTVAPNTDNAEDVRYLFNPFMICDLQNFREAVGYRFLPLAQFIKIDAVTQNRGVPDYSYQPKSPYNKGGNYQSEARLPGHILNDILNTYSGDGVTEITALRNVRDDVFIAKISKALLGENVPTKMDVYFEEFPCPVLPEWFEQISARASRLITENSDKPELAKNITSIFRNLQTAFSRALEGATRLTQKANARMVSGTGSKQYDPLERRCFLALGQEIPDRLPTIGQSAGNRTELVENAIISIAQNQTQQNQTQAVAVAEPTISPADIAEILESNRLLREQNALLMRQNESIPAISPLPVVPFTVEGDKDIPASVMTASGETTKKAAETTKTAKASK